MFVNYTIAVFIVIEIWALLNRMWKGALILFAQGVGRWVFFSAVLQQFVLVFSVAVALIGGLAYLTSWSCDGILGQLQVSAFAAPASGDVSGCSATMLRDALVDAAPFAVGAFGLAIIVLFLLVYLSSGRRDTFARQLSRH